MVPVVRVRSGSGRISSVPVLVERAGWCGGALLRSGDVLQDGVCRVVDTLGLSNELLGERSSGAGETVFFFFFYKRMTFFFFMDVVGKFLFGNRARKWFDMVRRGNG